MLSPLCTWIICELMWGFLGRRFTNGHPIILCLLGKCLIWINQLLMRSQLYNLGHNVYTTSLDESEMPTVLYIGGFLSGNLSGFFVRSILRYIRRRYPGKIRILFYNAPETRHGSLYTTMESKHVHLTKTLGRLLLAGVLKHPSDLRNIHIIGHSYGASLTVRLRYLYPIPQGSRITTELWEPVPCGWDKNAIDRAIHYIIPFRVENRSVYGYIRNMISGYILQYKPFFDIGCQGEPTDDVFLYIRHCGITRIVLCEHDELMMCGLSPLIHVIPAGYHGDVFWSLDSLTTNF
jgi:hypothetical protein